VIIAQIENLVLRNMKKKTLKKMNKDPVGMCARTCSALALDGAVA